MPASADARIIPKLKTDPPTSGPSIRYHTSSIRKKTKPDVAEAINSMLPLMFVSSLIGFFAVAYIFAKGHDGGSGLKEGFWFGVVLGSVFTFFVTVPNYVVLSIGQKLGKHFKLQFQAKNLTNPAIQTVYRSEFIDSDVTKTSFTEGIEYTLGISAQFEF